MVPIIPITRLRDTDENLLDCWYMLHSIAETAMKNGNSKFKAILAVVQQ